MNNKYTRLKFACYSTNITMSVVGNLSPLLFLIFHSQYGISYSLLGLLILINFITQLGIDLIFSFFSHKFNIPKVVLSTPLFAAVGLCIYALVPYFWPNVAYIGLVIGTILFSTSCGLAEVLISPLIAAIPSDNPEREMSKLHSVYAWGVVFVVIFSTLFLLIFGSDSWHWLAITLSIIPTVAFFLYYGTSIPPMETPKHVSGTFKFFKNKFLWVCVGMIFFGGAAEVAMAQWSSSFMEAGLGLDKVWGDVFGVAFFAIMLGLGRTMYAKFGKHLTRVLLLGVSGATLCYLLVALCNIPLIGLLACGITGLCVSMLWPGCLVVASEHFPNGGVFIYALMAAGGDFGASVAPQIIGIITDSVIANPSAIKFASSIGLTASQLGLKLGMLVGMLFPLIAIPLYIYAHKKRNA